MKRFLFLAALITFVTAGCGNLVFAEDGFRTLEATRPAVAAKPRPLIATNSARPTNIPPKTGDRPEMHLLNFNLKDRIASRSAELKLKLDSFKDQRKAQAVENINTEVSRINGNQTSAMLKTLNTLSTIISKLETRLNGVTDKDTSVAKTSVESAKISIATAQTAVQSQAEKDYPIEATSEAKIKDEVLGIRVNLHTDLDTVHALVNQTKKDVIATLEITVKTLTGGNSGQ